MDLNVTGRFSIYIFSLSPEKCKSDEQYYTNKPDCKNTCENYNNPGVRCAAGKPGCFCKEGLVKRKDGKCVKPENCSETGKQESMFLKITYHLFIFIKRLSCILICICGKAPCHL